MPLVGTGLWLPMGPAFSPRQERSQNLCVQEVKTFSPGLWQNYKAQWIKLPSCPSIPSEHCMKVPLNVTHGGLGSAFTSLWEQLWDLFPHPSFPVKGECKLPFSSCCLLSWGCQSHQEEKAPSMFRCVCSPKHPFKTKYFLKTMLHDCCYQQEVCAEGRKLYLDSK